MSRLGHMTGAEFRELTRLAWSEEQFKAEVIREATSRGWLKHHDRPARTDKGWRTAIEGDPGFPDLVLAKDGRVLIIELKSEKGRVSAEQKAWIKHTRGQVWRPRDWTKILLILDGYSVSDN